MVVKTICTISFAATLPSLLLGFQPASAGSHVELKPQLKLQDHAPHPVPQSSGDTLPTESVDLNYEPIDQSYDEQNKGGTQGQPEGAYDIRQKKRH